MREDVLLCPPTGMQLEDVATRLALTPPEVIRTLFMKGIMAGMNQRLDVDAVRVVAASVEADVLVDDGASIQDGAKRSDDDIALFSINEEDADENDVFNRPPVVAVMGHVDHGKTSLLDYVRRSRVASGEAGGITQSIGAYNVDVPWLLDDDDEDGDGAVGSLGEDWDGPTRGICFLDTPGHEAFSAMRARGAKVTDVAIVIVAADDGVRPQTREAVAHAQAAGVPIVVAVNKIDRPGADPEKVLREMASECSLVPEAWGGDVPFIQVSAKTGEGIDELLEMVLLVAETLELRADAGARAAGTVIEAELDKRRGAVATVLVQAGTLRVGDIIVAGPHQGRVRMMTDDLGDAVEEAGASTAVRVYGLGGVPSAGTTFAQFDTAADAQKASVEAEERERDERLASMGERSVVSLSSLATYDSEEAEEQALQTLPLVVKADASGAVEAVRAALGALPQDRVSLRYLVAAAGELTVSDVELAFASEALCIGFNVEPSEAVQARAKSLSVEIWSERVIYRLVDQLRARMEGRLAEVRERVPIGTARVKAVFGGGSSGRVAGCEVADGQLRRGAYVEVSRGRGRNAVVVATDRPVNSLRRVREEVPEVDEGEECGLGVEGFKQWEEGDRIECYDLLTKSLSLEEASTKVRAGVDSQRMRLGLVDDEDDA